jgi:iturin family lipopeptide synthetase A
MTAADHRNAVAIVGLAGRFSGAADARAFWRRICAGDELLTRLQPDEMRLAGVPEALSGDPRYVPVNGVLEHVDAFDAGFFGMSPRDASITDPQHRVFLELAWHALEDAGHDPARYRGLIGVYAGCGFSTYLLHHLLPNRNAFTDVGELRLRMGNGQDYLATRTSFALDLRGPSISVNTACSTSLVAVHLACEALLNVQCDMALAGGISIQLPQDKGYLYDEGGILSPDGHCRAFDASARGTVSGNGGAVVVLKRVEDAIADRNRIYAVVRGSAINNDGAAKAGYTAPSIDGQMRVIVEAQAMSGVAADAVGYVETHGTGTPIGDPIEFAALTAAFRKGTSRRQFCAIGSVKTNTGHLDEAAGVTGLVKTALSLQHQQLPPSLHFQQPNPELNYEASPFYVNTESRPWPAPADGSPRAAGVSSFGIGGTNAHVVLEEAERAEAPVPMRPVQLLPISARTPESLARHVSAITSALQEPGASLADVSWTLQVGRRAFASRQYVVAATSAEAAANAARPRQAHRAPAEPPPVVFMFSGQASQHVGMTEGLYRHEPVFRDALDRCAELLRPALGRDLRTLLYPANATERDVAAEALACTEFAQPAIVAIEYALIQLWQHWGVRPVASIGHSIGEYLSAHIAGVMDLETLLAVVAARARLMQSAEPGAMLAVPMAAEQLSALASDTGAEVAVFNADDRCVIAGPSAAIELCEQRLAGQGITPLRLPVGHAFHTAAMEPLLARLRDEVGRHKLNAPAARWISNVTGDWIAPTSAVDPAYYSAHARQPVQFAAGVRRLLADYPDAIFLEIGAGQSLTQLARRSVKTGTTCIASCAAPGASAEDHHRTLLASLGELWVNGVAINWDAFGEPGRQRVSVPGTPFDRARHWIDARGNTAVEASRTLEPLQPADLSRWLFTPEWRRTWPDGSPQQSPETAGGWLLFADEGGRGLAVRDELQRRGHRVTSVKSGDDVDAILASLAQAGTMPRSVAHLWSLDAPADFSSALDRGFQSLISLARSLAKHRVLADTSIAVVSSGLQRVIGDETPHAGQAAVLGAIRVIPQEFHGTACRSIDVDAGTSAAQLAGELLSRPSAPVVALRGAQRWAEAYAPLPDAVPVQRLRPDGVYLITGGFGSIALPLAGYLARTVRARLVLVGRRAITDPVVVARIRELEALGAGVLPIQADVADEQAMAAAIVEAERAWGRIDGVFHLANASAREAFVAIDALDPSSRDHQMHAKARGALVLERLLEPRPPDFVCLFSSLASVLGGLGFAAYAAANHVLDALACAHANDARTEWLVVNWDGWQQPGTDIVEANTIALANAPDVFARVLQAPRCGQIVVSTTDLQTRRERWVTPHAKPPSLQAPKPRQAGDLSLSEQVAAVWREMLGLERVDAGDDFFHLRGDSLVATQLVARVNRLFRAQVSLRQFLSHPTLGAMIEALSTGAGDAAGIESAPPAVDYPLTHAQRRLWILAQRPDASAAYNMSYALRVTGALDVERLRLALADCIARHEILRTAFVAVGGEPRQRVLPSCDCQVPVRDLRDVADSAAAVNEELREESARPFDLSQPPLVRVRALRLSAEEHLLLVTLHHIVGDGISLNVLMRDLHACYTARSGGAVDPLPALPIQFKDFSVWQEQQTAGESRRASRDYWTARLNEAAVLDLPTDRPWPPQPRYDGDRLVFRLDAGERRRLDDVCRANGATLFSLLLSATAIALHHFTGQDDIVVGTPVSGRSRPELEHQIGYYLNNVVLRETVRRRELFPVLLGRVQQSVTEALSHQDYPFDRIIDDLGIRAQAGRSPLFDVQVNLMPAETPSLLLGDLAVAAMRTTSGSTMFPINVMFGDSANGLAAEIEYATAVFDRVTMQGLADRLHHLLRAIGEQPGTSVRSLCRLLDGPPGDNVKPAFLSAFGGSEDA